MEKGILSKASQDAINVLLVNLVKDEKPAVKLSVSIGGKLLFLVGDDIFAEKLPDELKEKARNFFDMLLVTKEYDAALVIGIELVTEIYELFKKPKPE